MDNIYTVAWFSKDEKLIGALNFATKEDAKRFISSQEKTGNNIYDFKTIETNTVNRGIK